MDIGVPAEIKTAERRVGLTPAAVGELVNRGHHVTVEMGAGDGAGFNDIEYKEAGAAIASTADDVFANSEMIVKVKEPLAPERARLESHHTLFTYLHLAADLPQTEDLLNSGAACVAYETVTDDAGRLPLLAPMSAIAGRMSIQAGAHALEATQGGAGLLLGGVPGVRPGKVVIIGGGVVGENAAEMAVGQGADVTVLDRSPAVLESLAKRFGGRVRTVYSTKAELEASVYDADLVIGAGDFCNMRQGLDEAMDLFADSFIRSRMPDVRSTISGFNAPSEPGQTFRLRPFVPWRLAGDGDDVVIVTAGGEVRFPAAAEPGLHILLDGGTVSLATFTDLEPDAARDTLGKLHAFGLIVPDEA